MWIFFFHLILFNNNENSFGQGFELAQSNENNHKQPVNNSVPRMEYFFFNSVKRLIVLQATSLHIDALPRPSESPISSQSTFIYIAPHGNRQVSKVLYIRE